MSSWIAILAVSIGAIEAPSGSEHTIAAAIFVPMEPWEGSLSYMARCMMGKRKNLDTRMYVARSISGPTPCVTNPFIPCAAWKFRTSVPTPTLPSAADDIFRARTRSTGYLPALGEPADPRGRGGGIGSGGDTGCPRGGWRADAGATHMAVAVANAPAVIGGSCGGGQRCARVECVDGHTWAGTTVSITPGIATRLSHKMCCRKILGHQSYSGPKVSLAVAAMNLLRFSRGPADDGPTADDP